MTGSLSTDNLAQVLAVHPHAAPSREEGAPQTVFNEAPFRVSVAVPDAHPSAEVAEAVGYADVTAFSRAFRGWAQCTGTITSRPGPR
jgi:AraC-like DNA-binding protein